MLALVSLGNGRPDLVQEQISDFIRGKYKDTTGSDMPIKDKPTALDRNTD